MFELNLEPWEKLPENFNVLASLIKKICNPLMPDEPEIGKLYRIYPEGCISGNGTAYHGNVRIGQTPKKLIVFLNGGGGSYNEYMAARPSNAFTGGLADTFYSNDGEWIGDYFLREGMNKEQDSNPFLDWSMIHILYCNGDFHAGDGELTYTARDGSQRIMPYHGYRNALAVIRLAKQYLPDPDELIIAGSSAGGFGVSLIADDIIQAFPDCQNITCCVDSALGIKADWQGVAEKIWHSPLHIAEHLKSDNLVQDCLLALHEKYRDRIKILFLCSVRDALLAVNQSALDVTYEKASLESGRRFQQDLTKMCEVLREKIPGIGLYIFSGPMDAPGYDNQLLTLHCALNNYFLFSRQENDKTVADWLLAAVAGQVEQIGLIWLQAGDEEIKRSIGKVENK